MATLTTLHGREESVDPSYPAELTEILRIIAVAGILTGIVIAGLGGRLAMFLLRVTSPEYVAGMESDDGFTIGQFTLGGTYNLITVGAAIGVIGAAAYIAVAPWLVGPTWFRRATVSVTAAVVGGAMLIHSDGVDFQLLEPRWFAVALFLALPGLFGWAVAFAVDTVAVPTSWTAQGARAWAVPLVLVLLVPLSLAVFVPVALVVAALLPLRRLLFRPILSTTAATWVVRSCFATVPVLGAIALIADLSELF